MSMSITSDEQQPAGVSTAESECSGSCSSKQASPMDDKVIPAEQHQEQPLSTPSTASASPSSTPPASPRSSIKRIFSTPSFKRAPSQENAGRRHTVSNNSLNLSSSSTRLNHSAPTISICAPSIESQPIRSIMTSRTLHESLHRNTAGRPRNTTRGGITFGQVDIREYERILGDNPSVTSGPPLSIGWRYAPSPLRIDVETFESGKGLPRSSAEYLVPNTVREQLLREHADASRRDIAAVVRNINRLKQQRRNTVVNISMTSTQERVEKVKRGVQKAIGRRSSYKNEEARLWEEAHAVALEKARQLEESVRNGEKLSMREVYKVGTPWNNVVPSIGNSVGREERGDLTVDTNETTRSLPPAVKKEEMKSPALPSVYRPSSKNNTERPRRRVSIDSSYLDKSERLCPSKSRIKKFNENFRHSDSDLAMTCRSMTMGSVGIVATENDEDVDNILAKLVLDESTRSGGAANFD